MLDLPLVRPVRVLHAGALEVEDEPPVYAPLRAAGACEAVGVDPMESPEQRAQALADGRFVRYHDAVLGAGDERELRVCRAPSRSSLYEPNQALASLFDGFAEGSEVVERRTVRTVRLDELECDLFDLVVLDVQGAEVDVLRGGGRTVGGALVVHAEVELVEQYVGQPLLGAVDVALRELGFAFHAVHSIGTRPFAPAVLDPLRTSGLKQWLWADVVYVRDLATLPNLGRDRLVLLGVIAHLVYSSYDLAHTALRLADAELAQAYLRGLRAE